MPLPSVWLIVYSVLFSLHSVNETSASNFAIFSFSSKATVSIDVPPHKFSEELDLEEQDNLLELLPDDFFELLMACTPPPPPPPPTWEVKNFRKVFVGGIRIFYFGGEFCWRVTEF